MVLGAQPGDHVLVDQDPGAADLDRRQAARRNALAHGVDVRVQHVGGFGEGQGAHNQNSPACHGSIGVGSWRSRLCCR